MRTLACSILLVLTTACRTAGTRDGEPAAPVASSEEAVEEPSAPAPDAPGASEETLFAFVFLKTGPASVRPEEASELMIGHLANIERLAVEGSMLVAGPYVGAPPESGLRGIFILDADPELARELVGTDPAVQAGALAAEILPWRTRSPLRRLRELEVPGEPARQGRAYVLVEASEAGAARLVLEPLAREGLVLFGGEFTAGARAGHALFLVDARTAAEAQEMLDFACSSAGTRMSWTLRPWYSSGHLVDLARLAR